MPSTSSIEMQSLVDSHEHPFLVIDRDFRVVAVNAAFERAYGTERAELLGRHCYAVSHGHDRPCFEEGEDCPYRQVYEHELPHSCLHSHRDDQGRHHLVRVTAHPLKSAAGDLYLGESFQEHAVDETAERKTARMVGSSAAFLRVLEQLKVAAQHDLPVLLEGETGTGKDLAAEFLHRQSQRNSGPFLTLVCTALPEGLFESEVFGHERGAFTGSAGGRQGLYEMAAGGTLFLDEIGELPAALQAKLLRVLETGEYRRVGGRKTLRADVRLVCATNQRLSAAVHAGRFRQDLYYRIACLEIQMPTLRQRPEDIPELANALLLRFNAGKSRHYRLTAEALGLLRTYAFPGNVRELRNMLYVAATRAGSGVIDVEHLASLVAPHAGPGSLVMHTPPATLSDASGDPPAELQDSLRDAEARHIERLLAEHAGNRRKTAAALGIGERTLYRKLRLYGLG